MLRTTLLTLAIAALAVAPAAASHSEPTLKARATLPANATSPAPFTGAPNYVTIESVLPVGDDQLAIVNDTNFGSTGRNASLPDYSDFIRVRVPGLQGRR